MKSLDAKLAEIKANPKSRAFIIADAKDADMAFGVRAPGPRKFLAGRGGRPAQFSPEVWTRDEFGYRNLPESEQPAAYSRLNAVPMFHQFASLYPAPGSITSVERNQMLRPQWPEVTPALEIGRAHV